MKQLLLSALFVVLLAGPLFAQPDERPRRGMRDQIEKLNLSEEQQTALRELRSGTHKEMIDLQSEIKKTKVDLEEMKRAQDPDRARFEKLTRAIADLRVRQALLKFDTHQKMMQQLTPEQQEAFKTMQRERGKNFQEKERKGPPRHRRGER